MVLVAILALYRERTPMWKRVVILSAAAIGASAYLAAVAVIPSVAAGALLHPARKPVHGQPPAHCLQTTFDGAGVTLSGWRCGAVGPRRATIVFLHGIADNRESVSGAIGRFVERGYDVVAYDSRAHGASTGDACTYGYWEKRDLRRVIDTIDSGLIVLLGTSLGAAVALQEAADDSRVGGIVAAEVFSDLATVARERAPRLLTASMIERAFEIAEARGHFRVDEVSPMAAARRITVPVMLIHGAADVDTTPDHSRRVAAALAGPKELLLVAGARHNESLRSPDTWQRIDRWIDAVVTGVD
jgi:pimeloyl-ACP methyl ester carboxylesterase